MMMLKKVPRKSGLFDAVIQREADRARAVKRLERELSALYDGYFLRVTKFLKSKRFATPTEVINQQATIKAISELTNILVESGYEDVIAAYQDEFDSLTTKALQYFEEFGVEPTLAGFDKENIQALETWRDFTETQLRDTINSNLIDPLQSALLQVNMGNQTRESVVDRILELSDTKTPWIAEVIVDDAFAQYQRAVITQKADNLDMEIYVYLGPMDAITSDQCEEMLTVDRHGVPGMLYKDEITMDLHPDLTRDPLIGGGHPRCRHHWSPVSEAYAESQGFELRRQQEAA